MVPDAVEDDVVTPATLGEILLRVVDDPVRADRPDHVRVPGAAYAGDLRAEALGDLYRERAHAPGRAVDQGFLPGLHPPGVAKPLQRGDRGQRRGGRLLERDVAWLAGQDRLRGTRVLGEGPLRAGPGRGARRVRTGQAQAEYLITWLELRHVPAGRRHHACHVHPQPCGLRPAQPGHDAK